MIEFGDNFRKRRIVLEGTVTDKWFEMIEELKNKQNEQKELMYYGTFVDFDGIGDSLVLGIDISKKDGSAICVGRNVNGKYEIINHIYGEEAEKIYYSLIGEQKYCK